MKDKRLKDKMNEDESLALDEDFASKRKKVSKKPKDIKHKLVVAGVTIFCVVLVVLSISLPLTLKDDEPYIPGDDDKSYGYSQEDYIIAKTNIDVIMSEFDLYRKVAIASDATHEFYTLKINSNTVGVRSHYEVYDNTYLDVIVYTFDRLHSFYYGNDLEDKCTLNTFWQDLYIEYAIDNEDGVYNYTIVFSDVTLNYYIEVCKSSPENITTILNTIFGIN